MRCLVLAILFVLFVSGCESLRVTGSGGERGVDDIEIGIRFLVPTIGIE